MVRMTKLKIIIRNMRAPSFVTDNNTCIFPCAISHIHSPLNESNEELRMKHLCFSDCFLFLFLLCFFKAEIDLE